MSDPQLYKDIGVLSGRIDGLEKQHEKIVADVKEMKKEMEASFKNQDEKLDIIINDIASADLPGLKKKSDEIQSDKLQIRGATKALMIAGSVVATISTVAAWALGILMGK